MFHHLLVPLDGSHLAEATLLPARTLAGKLGARITLLHVIEKGAPARVHGDRHLMGVAEAEAYLRDLAERLQLRGLTVDYHVHDTAEGNVTRSINDHAAEMAADLIVLATHGGGDVRHALFGSIAQQVIGAGEVPVLIIHPEAAPTEFHCRRLLVPLDGAPDHESSVPVASDLAATLGASVHLVTAVPRPAQLTGLQGKLGRMLPSTTAMLLDAQERELASRLDVLAAELRLRGVPADRTIDRGDAIPFIMQALRATDADLLVLATHSKRGWAAFWAGSVAPRLLAQWRRPTLLVRAQGE